MSHVDYVDLAERLLTPLLPFLRIFLETIECEDNNFRPNFFFIADEDALLTYKFFRKEVCAAILCGRTDFLYWRCLTNPGFLLKVIAALILHILVLPLLSLIIVTLFFSEIADDIAERWRWWRRKR